MQENSKSRRRAPALVVASLAVAGLVGAGTVAAYTDQDQITDNTFNAGHLDLVVGPNTAAITAEGMAPDDRVIEAISVANEGTVPLDYSISVEQTDDSQTLGEVLNVSMFGDAGSVDDVSGDNRILYQEGFPSLDTVALSEADRTLHPGETETLFVEVHMQRSAETEYHQDSTTFEFTFDAIQSVMSDELAAPTITSAVANVDSATFGWVGPGGPASPPASGFSAMSAASTQSDGPGVTYEYRFRVNHGSPGLMSQAGTEVTIPAPPESQVDFQVRTVAGEVKSQWSRATATTLTEGSSESQPLAPTSLIDWFFDGETAELTWQDAGDVSYEYRYRLDFDDWTTLTTDATTVSFDADGSLLQFQVRATDGERYSPWTGLATFAVWDDEGSESPGEPGDGEEGDVPGNPDDDALPAPDAARFSAGSKHSMALDVDGNLWTWGDGTYGQLGHGDTESQSRPTQVDAGTEFTSVAAGSIHSMALDSEGNLWTWGDGTSGQLGHGDTESRETPGLVSSEVPFTSIAAGIRHSMALDVDGNLWTWGHGLHGKLGDGTVANRSTPVQVDSEAPFTSISAGSNHSMALDVDGNLWTWGDGLYGQLGHGYDGQPQTRYWPTQVSAAETFTSIVASRGNHSMALDVDGNLWTWGHGGAGKLGHGDTLERHRPGKVSAEVPFISTVAGPAHSMALDVDGNLWTWGSGSSGKLGHGGSATHNRPMMVVNDTLFTSIAVGDAHSMALDVDGNLWTWGDGSDGQLGHGDNAQRSQPLQIEWEEMAL